MKSDMAVKNDVVDELVYNPAVNAAKIGVSVTDGVVTLTGHVPIFAEKIAALEAAQIVRGVKAVIMDIEIILPSTHLRSDTELADSVRQAIRARSQLASEKLAVVVEDGWVTLSGIVDWDYQRTLAAHTVRYQLGVRGLTNLIELRHRLSHDGIEAEIEAALKRQAEREAHRIDIAINDGIVHLRGEVKSIAEERAIIGAAYNAPGVRKVISELEVVLA